MAGKRIYEGQIRDQIASKSEDSKILLRKFSAELFASIQQALRPDAESRQMSGRGRTAGHRIDAAVGRNQSMTHVSHSPIKGGWAIRWAFDDCPDQRRPLLPGLNARGKTTN